MVVKICDCISTSTTQKVPATSTCCRHLAFTVHDSRVHGELIVRCCRFQGQVAPQGSFFRWTWCLQIILASGRKCTRQSLVADSLTLDSRSSRFATIHPSKGTTLRHCLLEDSLARRLHQWGIALSWCEISSPLSTGLWCLEGQIRPQLWAVH